MILPYLPSEMIEHIMKFMISSTLQNCLKIPYLTEMAHKELYKRYQQGLKILIVLGMNENEAKRQLDNGQIYLWSVRNKVTDTSVRAIVYGCLGLMNISLAGCFNITDNSVIAISQDCSELAWISLHGCSNITDASITALARSCPGLTDIYLNSCSNITDASITALVVLAQGCPRLMAITLRNCSNITDTAKKLLRAKGVRIY